MEQCEHIPNVQLRKKAKFSACCISGCLTVSYLTQIFSRALGGSNKTQWRSQPKILGGEGKFFGHFRRTTVICLGYRFFKHKMTGYAKPLRDLVPWVNGYAYDGTLTL